MADTHSWWQRGVIYQIYPRSFLDTDGDGIGDLRGIVRGLAYLAWLGIDALWISPIYPSPMADFGYDISDHTAIDPRFGSLADFDAMIAEAHRLGLRVILDYVPNHTSDRHPWFLASRTARDDPTATGTSGAIRRPTAGRPTTGGACSGAARGRGTRRRGSTTITPISASSPISTGGIRRSSGPCSTCCASGSSGASTASAWTPSASSWRTTRFATTPPTPTIIPDSAPTTRSLAVYTADRPETLRMVALMRGLVDRYPDRLLIGELYLPIERLVAYYGVDGDGVHLPANFHLISVEWQTRRIGQLIAAYEAALPAGGWPNWVLGNHDKPRVSSRIGPAQARVAAMLLLTLRGTPTLYYGDEIGMADVEIPPGLVQDPWERNVPGLGLGRDPERTPMQWDASPHAGFTVGRPWLPVARDATAVNVARERDDPTSMLMLYRRLIALRRAHPALSVGRYEPVDAMGDVLAYARGAGANQCLVALNLGSTPQNLRVPAAFRDARVLLSTALDREGTVIGDSLALRGDEGVVAAVS